MEGSIGKSTLIKCMAGTGICGAYDHCTKWLSRTHVWGKQGTWFSQLLILVDFLTLLHKTAKYPSQKKQRGINQLCPYVYWPCISSYPLCTFSALGFSKLAFSSQNRRSVVSLMHDQWRLHALFTSKRRRGRTSFETLGGVVPRILIA